MDWRDPMYLLRPLGAGTVIDPLGWEGYYEFLRYPHKLGPWSACIIREDLETGNMALNAIRD